MNDRSLSLAAPEAGSAVVSTEVSAESVASTSVGGTEASNGDWFRGFRAMSECRALSISAASGLLEANSGPSA
jgi:hypothetical protein